MFFDNNKKKLEVTDIFKLVDIICGYILLAECRNKNNCECWYKRPTWHDSYKECSNETKLYQKMKPKQLDSYTGRIKSVGRVSKSAWLFHNQSLKVKFFQNCVNFTFYQFATNMCKLWFLILVNTFLMCALIRTVIDIIQDQCSPGVSVLCL